MGNRLESSVEKAIVKEIERRGFMTVKIQGTKGWPDRLVLLPDGKHFFLEVKRENGGVLSPHQKRNHASIRSLSHNVFTVDSFLEFQNILDLCLR